MESTGGFTSGHWVRRWKGQERRQRHGRWHRRKPTAWGAFWMLRKKIVSEKRELNLSPTHHFHSEQRKLVPR